MNKKYYEVDLPLPIPLLVKLTLLNIAVISIIGGLFWLSSGMHTDDSTLKPGFLTGLSLLFEVALIMFCLCQILILAVISRIREQERENLKLDRPKKFHMKFEENT